MMRLLVTRRVVPLDRTDEFFQLWNELRSAVLDQGGKAWLFGGTTRDDHFLEFVETSTSAPMLEESTIAELLDTLRQRFPPLEEEEWLEVKPS